MEVANSRDYQGQTGDFVGLTVGFQPKLRGASGYPQGGYGRISGLEVNAVFE